VLVVLEHEKRPDVASDIEPFHRRLPLTADVTCADDMRSADSPDHTNCARRLYRLRISVRVGLIVDSMEMTSELSALAFADVNGFCKGLDVDVLTWFAKNHDL
jgi:hypothetical protein